MYGVSSKDGHVAYIVRFDNGEDAQQWLHTEERDFRSRELLTEIEVVDQHGDYYRAMTDDNSHPCEWAGGVSIDDFTPVWPDGVR